MFIIQKLIIKMSEVTLYYAAMDLIAAKKIFPASSCREVKV
jgi:hypothetical protein